MAGTTKLDMGCVVLLRHEGVLGDMNLCENPAITCAQHPAQWPGLPCAGLGWRVALEGHVCCVHSGRCACPRFQPLKPFFVPLVDSLLQEIFCFCGNLPAECFPPILGRSSGLFIRLSTLLNDLNSVPCVPKSWSAKQHRLSLSPKKGFLG